MSSQPLVQQQQIQSQVDPSIQAISSNNTASINGLCKQIKELTIKVDQLQRMCHQTRGQQYLFLPSKVW